MPYIARRIGNGSGGRITLSQLSDVALTAPCHFHRIFRAVTGESVHQYVRRVRLEYAAYRLLLGERSVLDVALDAGYESHSAFSRAFRQQFNRPPAALRVQSATNDDAAVHEVEPALMPSARVAVVRHFGPYPEARSAWEELAAGLTNRGLDPSRLQAVGVVHDGPECGLAGSIRYDACAVVPEDFWPDARVGVSMLPRIEGIGAEHHGLPELILCSHVRLVVEWLTNGGSPVRPVPYYERYHAFPFLGGGNVVDAGVVVSLD